jgi:hypothetical protein
MPGNLIALLLSSLLGWLLYQFRLRKAASPAEIRRLGPFYLVLACFLVFNAFLAWQGRAALVEAIRQGQAPLRTWKGLEDARTGAGIVLRGTVSAENEPLYWEYVAYVDGGHLYSPQELLLELRDGVVAITNDDYAPRNWPLGTGSYPHLVAGDSIVVVGTVERGVYMAGPARGQETTSVHAEIVWAGSDAAFVERAQQRIIFPTVLWAANLAVAAMLVALPVASWWVSSRARQDLRTRREPKEEVHHAADHARE